MTPLQFLTELWQYKPDEHYVLIWTHPDKRSRWFTEIPAAAEYVRNVNGGRDVYVGVGLAGKDHGPTHRCVSEEITAITGLWADLDLLSDAHGKRVKRYPARARFGFFLFAKQLDLFLSFLGLFLCASA